MIDAAVTSRYTANIASRRQVGIAYGRRLARAIGLLPGRASALRRRWPVVKRRLRPAAEGVQAGDLPVAVAAEDIEESAGVAGAAPQPLPG